MRIETLKYIINAFNVASKEAHRPHLCAVLLEPCRDKVKIVATDGHHLSTVTVTDNDTLAALGGERYFISRDLLPSLKALLKTAGRTPVVNIERKENGAIYLSLFSVGVEFPSLKSTGFSYPQYEAVIPKNREAYTVSVGVNPELLMNVLKAMQEGKAKGIKISINPSEKMGALIVEHGGHESLVMPMRI